MTQDTQVQRYSNGRNSQSEPDPEVNVTGKRRQYSQAYKVRIPSVGSGQAWPKPTTASREKWVPCCGGKGCIIRR